MIVKGILDEDFINFKEPSMFIAFPYCNFKCEKESGVCCCQNSDLAKSQDIEVSYNSLVSRYIQNNITSSIVMGGLEPLDSFDDLSALIKEFRAVTDDSIIIYTGYSAEEIETEIKQLRQYKNIIIKFGRFIPNDTSKYDEILGINLASHNQYAIKIS